MRCKQRSTELSDELAHLIVEPACSNVHHIYLLKDEKPFQTSLYKLVIVYCISWRIGSPNGLLSTQIFNKCLVLADMKLHVLA